MSRKEITKNPESVTFDCAPFYNLANIRKDTLSLITRSSEDPAKVEAIHETLTGLAEFLAVRAEHAEGVRAANVAAQKVADEKAAKAAAEWREADAKALLADGKANVKRAEGILKTLKGDK